MNAAPHPTTVAQQAGGQGPAVGRANRRDGVWWALIHRAGRRRPHRVAPAGHTTMNDGDTAEATAARREYVTEVTQLVDEQSEVLFGMVTAAAEQASSGARRIDVTREARSLTVSVGERATILRIETITDRPEDLGRAQAFMTSQARCIVPTPDGTTAEWVLVLQRVGAGDAVSRHTWMDARAAKPVDAAAVATTLRSLDALQ